MAQAGTFTGGEQELIRRVTSAMHRAAPLPRSHLRQGIGDDAAIFSIPAATELAISTDVFLEGVHFLRKLHPPESVGYKSLARAVSDLAAVGAQPHSFFLTIALPQNLAGDWFSRFLAGLRRASAEFKIPLAGGDTTRHSQIFIQITVLGTLPRGGAVLRSGARLGDLIFVTGQLGAAEYGLRLLKKQRGSKYARPTSREPFLSAHLFPRPPLKFASRLARARIPTAMIDLSDGLSTDLGHICDASSVGARIEIEKLPVIQIPRTTTRAKSEDAVELALHSGEDYGLLFTVPPSRVRKLRAISRRTQLTRIGEITRQRGVRIIYPNGREERVHPRGWDPFRRNRGKK